MSEFSRWVTPLNHRCIEPLYANQTIEYEDFPCTINVTGSLLYTLFQERWQDIQIGHVVEGSVLELEFTQPPKICLLYDGYLTVVAEAWHLHLCVAAAGDSKGSFLPSLERSRRSPQLGHSILEWSR